MGFGNASLAKKGMKTLGLETKMGLQLIVMNGTVH